MLLIYKNMSLGGVMSENTSLVPVLERMGVSLGVGESTVEEICAEKGINTDFLLAVLNTFLNEDYSPEKCFKTVNAEDILSYVRASHEYYVKFQLPVIEAHLARLVKDDNSPLVMIKRMVVSLRQSITAVGVSDMEESSAWNEKECEVALTLVEDIKNLVIKHMTGHYDKNMCYALLFFLSSLQRDMRHYLRICSRVLIPMMK